MGELTSALARSGFLPHGYCFQWSPGLLWTMVGADALIALAYFSIPVLILAFVRQRPQVNFGGLAGLFSAFIFACGVTHVLDIWTIWRPDYELQTAGKVITAVISVLTAVAAWRLAPKLLALPSVRDMREAMTALQAEVDRRRSAEDHLFETEQSLAATLATIDAGFINFDGNGNVTRINTVAERITGWPAAEARGMNVWQVFDRLDRPPELLDRNPVEHIAERHRQGVQRQTVVVVSRDGMLTSVELNTNLTYDQDGSVRGVTIVFRDMSRLTSAESKVRRLAAAVESSADAIIVRSIDGQITDWNRAAERMFGYARTEAVGQPEQMLIPPEREAEELRTLRELALGRSVPPMRTVRVAKDGRRVEVSVQVSPLRDASGLIIGAVKSARDLTHQRQIEGALRQSEARLRLALESAAIGDWELEMDSGVIHRSHRFDQCFGLDDPLTDWGRDDLIAAVHEDDREPVAVELRAAMPGEPWHGEFRVEWPDGSLHWLRMDARAAVDEAGPARLIGIVADVTAVRSAEQARQQAIWLESENRRVQESSRLKSQFLANMSHELRTPLNSVIGFADLLASGVIPPGPRQQGALQHVASSGRHLLQMINDVLDLSKIEAGKLSFHPESVDLPALIDDVMATVTVLAEQRRLELVSTIDPQLHRLELDPSRLKQVLLNYLSNAIKFTEPGGRVSVSAVGEGPELWRLEVQDTGIGISPEEQARLFVEFQQLDGGLDKRHQGTGLGLALTRRLVEAQGGRVGVYSSVGGGSRFYAVLPRHVSGEAPCEHSLLLAMRDHPARDGLARELAQAGLVADTADTAAEVLRLARVRRYTELALDLSLPDAPGLATLASLREGGASMHAAVKALGFSTQPGGAIAFAVSDVLAKPLEREDLSRALIPLRHRMAGRRVLVVDDEPAARDLMCAMLGAAGIDAVAVDGGLAALRALPRLQPAAMVLDLMMPGVDGFQVLHAVRNDPQFAELPVLVWTAMALSADEIARLARSAQSLVAKGDSSALTGVRDALLHWVEPPSAVGEGA